MLDLQYSDDSSGMNNFDCLVTALRDALGSSGLTCDDVNLDLLKDLMKNYESNEKEWISFALADSNRDYTRNLVDEGNGKCNLLVLVWTPGKGSPIHSHSKAHCLMKILKGQLTETRYDFPPSQEKSNNPTSSDAGRSMKLIKESTYIRDDVAYMSDDLGVHQMWNKSDEFAVSLHLYTPPNIVRDGCYIFDAETGKGTLSKNCEYYSIRGNRLKGRSRESTQREIPSLL
ncbi:cysteine dioxygenase [Colletotrichum truncatum]|uniref:Cysteine dioxygenase n=1 Tax=Colletotrichum truncatum TaxID=5467 RepID=A0ACC3YHP4_COLTU|nr:cysteine dioxygenase [Colletotrichum truncatum]KAF6792953.1 cysteine dioxygenase [Colletotrichum truncatum]